METVKYALQELVKLLGVIWRALRQIVSAVIDIAAAIVGICFVMLGLVFSPLVNRAVDKTA